MALDTEKRTTSGVLPSFTTTLLLAKAPLSEDALQSSERGGVLRSLTQVKRSAPSEA